MGFSSFVVTIEPNPGVFFSGQLITGNVHAAVDSYTSCRFVKVTCEGNARVHWTESMSDKDQDGSSLKNYDASEEYFKLSFNLWNEPNHEIQPGNYVWPFQFCLPSNIPSSFEGTNGWVRYSVMANADIPSGYDEWSIIFFSVTDTEDLNYNEIAKRPMSIQKCDTSCYWCCAKGPVQLNFNCPRSGAVVGEGFKIRGEVANEGSKPVESTEITLRQEVKYYVEGSTKSESDVVTKIKRGGIEPGESDFYEDVPLNIEAVVPNLRHCSIMDLEYKISFSASFGSCAGVFDSATLYIGTVPFVPERMALPVQQGPYVTPSSPHDPNTAVMPTTGYPDPNTGAPYQSSPQCPMGLTGFVAPPPAVQYPPSQPMNTNLYGLRGAPILKECYFCTKDRNRIDKESPPPNYLSYAGILADAP